MEQTTILRLKPGAALMEQEERCCVSLGKRTRLARDPLQNEILRQLTRGDQSLDALTDTLRSAGVSSQGNTEISLILAQFILDFGEYLDNHSEEHE